jgi:hypothetical protein
MQSTKAADAGSAARGNNPEPDLRFGKIGISAVAAAIRFKPEPRPQAPAMVIPFSHD